MSESCGQDVDDAYRDEPGASITVRDYPESDGADPSRPGLVEAAVLARNTATEWLMAQRRADAINTIGAHVIGHLRPGVEIKLLFHEDIRQHEYLAARACELSAMGADIRTTSAPIPEMAISDRQLAIISSDPAKRDDRIVWYEQRKIISILTTIFDQVWTDAAPLASSSEPGAPSATPELLETERQLLALLAAGATDETAARHLGISLRTTRRHMAALMSRLAATSRFQAGVEAAKRGWLA